MDPEKQQFILTEREEKLCKKISLMLKLTNTMAETVMLFKEVCEMIQEETTE